MTCLLLYMAQVSNEAPGPLFFFIVCQKLDWVNQLDTKYADNKWYRFIEFYFLYQKREFKKEYALFGVWRDLIWLQFYKMWIYLQYHEVLSNHDPVPMIWLLKRQGPRWPVLLCTTTTVLLKSKNIYRYMYK